MVRTGYRKNVLLKIRMKDYNIMIKVKNFFKQPVKSDIRTYDCIQEKLQMVIMQLIVY